MKYNEAQKIIYLIEEVCKCVVLNALHPNTNFIEILKNYGYRLIGYCAKNEARLCIEKKLPIGVPYGHINQNRAHGTLST